MVSGSSAWCGVCGSVALLCVCLGGSCVGVACVFGVRGLGSVSLSLLGGSALGSRLMCAVEGRVLAVAVAAAAPVSLLGTRGFAPAEAVLPARADMGRVSHGECATVVSPPFPLSFVVFFFALLVVLFCGLVFSGACTFGSQGSRLIGDSLLFFLFCVSVKHVRHATYAETVLEWEMCLFMRTLPVTPTFHTYLQYTITWEL